MKTKHNTDTTGSVRDAALNTWPRSSKQSEKHEAIGRPHVPAPGRRRAAEVLRPRGSAAHAAPSHMRWPSAPRAGANSVPETHGHPEPQSEALSGHGFPAHVTSLGDVMLE